jgi:hypothetical protein
MSVTAYQSQQEKTASVIYRFYRWFFSVCIVLGIGAMLAVVITSPQYYSLQNGTPVMVATFATASPVMLQAHLLAGVFAVYLLPVSLLAMTWLALRRAPWLASIVMLIVLIGTFPSAAFSAQDALTADLVHMGSSPLFVTIAQRFNDDGVMSYYNVMFLIGTVLAPMLVGIALWRARAVPIWAAVLVTFSRLLVFSYPFMPSLPAVFLQILTLGLLFIGSIPAALAMLKVPSNQSQGSVDKSV